MTEFEKVRRDLSAEFAAAGRALMDYMTRPGMGPDTVLAAIPDTELYVIAGTLGGIARMLQKVGGAAPTVAGLEGLTRWQPEYGGDDQEPAIMETQDGEYVLFADVERWAASHAGASAVPAERDLGLPELADEFFAFGNLGGRFTLSWRECLRLYEAMTTSQAATPSTAAVRAAEWISVDDERKPEAKKPVLLYVRTLTRGEDDEGRPLDIEGAEVAMGEYLLRDGFDHSYFDCYTSPMSDNDWVTHWMPLPAAPVPAADGGNGGEG